MVLLLVHSGLVYALTGAVVCRHHTRRILSMLPAASSEFSVFTAISVISADAPRSVTKRRPSTALHTLTSRSSAPCTDNTRLANTMSPIHLKGQKYINLLMPYNVILHPVAVGISYTVHHPTMLGFNIKSF
jgi:hypothetical protein